MRLTDEQRALVEGNIKLAYFVANKNKKHVVLEFDDLLSICYEGLCEAALRFDVDKGFAFSTFAVAVMLNKVKLNNMRYFRSVKTISIEDMLNERYLAIYMPILPGCSEPSLETKNAMEKIKRYLRNFPGTQREKAATINFIRAPFLSQQDIADGIGISQKTVSTAINKFKKTLQAEMTG